MKEQIKQIEELAEDILQEYTNCYSEVDKEVLVKMIYNAGYRKQKEGEWIKHAASYECTACKEEFSVDGYAEDYDPITDWDLHFCPNCGAKMKGGAE